MGTALLLLGLAFLLIGGNGFFVAAEFGLVTVDRGAVEHAAEHGDRRARSVLAALRRLSFQLSGSQLGITVTSLVVGTLAEPSLATLLRPLFTAAGLPAALATGIALTLGIVLASLAQMVLGELVPKNWVIARPMQVARLVAGPQRAFSTVCRPLIVLLNGSANRVVRLLGAEPAEELASARSRGELVSVARHSARAGALEPDTADLFVRTVQLRSLNAPTLMTPRVDVIALQEDATAADVVNLTRATGLSRFPVYRDGLDDVTGIVHLKDALAVPEEQRGTRPVPRIAAPPLLIPQTLSIDRVLERLRGERPMAVLVDEYGGTAGVLTLEDLVEEVVGDVRDEHDLPDLPELTRLADHGGHPAWEADGGLRSDLLRRLGTPAPDGPFETVAGLVAWMLGRIPQPSDTVRPPGWRLDVLDVAHHRADRVRLVSLSGTPGHRAARPPQEGTERENR